MGKLPKIPEIYRKIPLKTAKNFRRASHGDGGRGSGFAGQGGSPIFLTTGGFGLTPYPLAMPAY